MHGYKLKIYFIDLDKPLKLQTWFCWVVLTAVTAGNYSMYMNVLYAKAQRAELKHAAL